MTVQNARSVVEGSVLGRLSAALQYASAMGWAVVPGCHQGRSGRRCGRDDCLVAGPHPVAARFERLATRNEYTIYRWWRQARSAPVLLAVGLSFSVIDVPAYAAASALDELRRSGCRLGPIAMTGAGRLLVWTAPDPSPDLSTVESYRDLGLRFRGAGEYVTAPPARDARWIESPVPYSHRVLPPWSDLLGSMMDACRRHDMPTTATHHGARSHGDSPDVWRRPCRGPWSGRSAAL